MSNMNKREIHFEDKRSLLLSLRDKKNLLACSQSSRKMSFLSLKEIYENKTFM